MVSKTTNTIKSYLKMKTTEHILCESCNFDKVLSKIRCQHKGNIHANFQTAWNKTVSQGSYKQHVTVWNTVFHNYWKCLTDTMKWIHLLNNLFALDPHQPDWLRFSCDLCELPLSHFSESWQETWFELRRKEKVLSNLNVDFWISNNNKWMQKIL